MSDVYNTVVLTAAEQAGFDVLITVDRNMQYQQTLRDRQIALVILAARTTNLDDLLMLVPEVLTALESLKRGSVIRVAGV